MSNEESNEESADSGPSAPKESTLAATGAPGSFQNLLHDVPLSISVELGRVTLNLRELAARLGPGSIIPLDRMAGEKLDIRVNSRLVARAEAVALGERCAVRIVEIVASGEADKS